MFNSLKDRAKEGTYLQSMKLLPVLSAKSDIYQLGLMAAEMMFSKRLWARGDKFNTNDLRLHEAESFCTK
jgi:hypothetical protein